MSKLDKKIISLILVFLLLSINFIPIVNATSYDEVIIKDEILKEKILESYDRNKDGKMTKEEMERITYLQIDSDIKELNGLEYATRLEDVIYNYSGQNVDFSKITTNAKISVYIDSDTKDTSNLSNIKNIFSINYAYNGKNMDFSKIDTDSVNDITINIGENDNIDISFLKVFKNLNSFYISNNKEQNIEIDFSHLEANDKLEALIIRNINIKNLSQIKQLTNLRYLSINAKVENEFNLDLSGIENLKELELMNISGYKTKNASSITPLTKIESVEIEKSTGFVNIDMFKNCKNMQSFSIYETDTTDISAVTNFEKLIYLNLNYSQVEDISMIKELKNLREVDIINSPNISARQIVNLMDFTSYDAYLGEKFEFICTPEINFNKGLIQYESDNEKVVKINNKNGEFEAISTGTANINAISNGEVLKTINVTVKKTNADITVGEGKDYSQITNGEVVLNANGDLWKTYTEAGKIEKIETDVKKYVYSYVYRGDVGAFNFSFIQKNNNDAKYVFNGNERSLKNVKDICDIGYIGTDNNFYEVLIDGSFKKNMSNVEKVVGPYIVSYDGKTYDQYGRLVANFKIILGTDDYIVDEENNVWYLYTSDKLIKQNIKFKNLPIYTNSIYQNKYVGQNNEIIKVNYDGGEVCDYIYTLYSGENEFLIDKNYNLILNGIKIMNNVSGINTIDDIDHIITRLDGSVWDLKLSGEAILIKLNEVEGKVYFSDETMRIKEAPAGAETAEVITGFDLKNLKIEDALSNSKFRKEYKVQAIKNNKTLDRGERISTGAKIQILNGNGKILNEYTALVYGDVTGKGNPGVADALTIVKNRLGKIKISNSLFMEAARVTLGTRKEGKMPSVADALAIIKAKLGRYEIGM